MARKRITIVLELDQVHDTPSGRARLADGTARRFHGWLGLAEAIDALAGMDTRNDGAPPVASSLAVSEPRTSARRPTRITGQPKDEGTR